MTAEPHAASPRRRSRLGRLLPWAAGVALLAGAIAAIAVFTNRSAPPEPQARNEPAQVAPKPKTVPLAREVREVAGRFILTAVARKNLDEAWRLSGPKLRNGFTLAQWRTGAIPVVPYPTDQIDIAPMKVDYSYSGSALLEVALLPKKGATVKPQIFYIGLTAYGTGKARHWLVDYWAPRGAPEIAAKPNG